MLYIFNNAESVVDILDDANQDEIYFDAVHVEETNKSNTFEFKIPAFLSQSANVVEGNFVGFTDIDGNFQMFEIMRVEETHSDVLMKYAICEHCYYELNDEFITSIHQTSTTALLALTSVLSGTRWEVGTITTTGTHDFSVDRNSSLYGVQHILSIWNCELNVRLTISNNVITHRYIDLLARRGNDTYKRFEYGEDIQEIKRTVDTSGLKTAIYGYGKSTEQTDGSVLRLNFSGVTWTYPTNPANKPNGQYYVEDATAKALYGRAGGTRNRFGIYESQDQEVAGDLLQESWDYLQTVNFPHITYEMKVLDLEVIAGLQSESVRLGDGVVAIDNEFKPALQVSARVITFKRFIREPERNEVVLGNFMPIITDESFRVRDTANLISDYKGSWDDKFSEATGVPTSALDGIIDVLNNEIYSAGGYVYITDTDGLIVYDAPTKETATKAVRIKGGIVAISNTKVAGEFQFRTFMTGDGVTASEVNTGTLRADLVTVQGDTKFYWTGTNIYVVNPTNASKQIRIGKYDGTNYGIGFTEDGGSTWNTIMDWSGVTVNQGNFKIKDIYGVLNNLYPTDNMLNDHSFEMLVTTGNVDANQTFAVDTNYTLSAFGWAFVGSSPRVLSTYATDVYKLALFDYQAAVVNTNSRPKQYVLLDQKVGLTGPYTISGYASAYGGTTSSGTATIEVWAVDDTLTRIGTSAVGIASCSIVYTEKFNWKRMSVTVTNLPANTDALEITPYRSSGTTGLNYIIDGMQCIPLDRPILYQAESQLWRYVHGLFSSYAIFFTALKSQGLFTRTITMDNVSGLNSEIVFNSYIDYWSDKGIIAFYDDLNTYNYWGDSTQNSCLLIEVQNDGTTTNSDVIALKSPAATVIDSKSCIIKGAEGGILKLLGGTVNHCFIEFYPNSTNLTNRRGWFGYDYAGSTTIALVNSVGNILLSVPTSSGVNIVMDNSEGGGAEPVWKPSSAGYGDLGTLSYYWKNVCTVNIYRNNEYALSSSEFKEDITETDHENIFNIVKNLHFKEFYYKPDKGREDDPRKRRVGLIAEELPQELTDLDKKALDVDNLVAMLGSTIQTLISKVETLENHILDLESKLK